jgi:hypothetical protein
MGWRKIPVRASPVFSGLASLLDEPVLRHGARVRRGAYANAGFGRAIGLLTWISSALSVWNGSGLLSFRGYNSLLFLAFRHD